MTKNSGMDDRTAKVRFEPTLTMLAAQYAKRLRRKTGKESSVEAFDDAIKLYIRSQGEALPTPRSLAAFVDDRRTGTFTEKRTRSRRVTRRKRIGVAKVSANTIRNNLRQLHALLRWALRQELVSSDSINLTTLFDDVAPQRVKTAPVCVTGDDLDRLLKLAKEHEPRIYGIVLTAAFTGLRLDELMHLWVWDIASGVLRVTAKPETATSPAWSPKGHAERELDLHPELARFLDSHIAGRSGRDWLFERKPGKPWTKAAYLPVQRRLFRRAGLRARGVHALRHGLGTTLAQGGSSVADIQKILGHADSATTMMYIHAARESQRRAMRELPIRVPA